MYFCLNRATAGGRLPFEDFVRLAADAGFTGADIELDYALQNGHSALRDLFANCGLKFGGWGLPIDWRGDDQPDSDSLSRLSRSATIARDLHIDSCATWIMPSSDRRFLENWMFHVEHLQPIAKILSDSGLRLGLEFVAPYHLRRKFSHEFIFTPGLMLELADAIGANVGLLVDSFHIHTSGTTFEHLSTLPGQRITLAHVNDAPAGPIAQLDDGDRLLPGNGAINIGEFLSALRATGYNGPVSLEVFNAKLRDMPPLEAARLAWQSCKPLLTVLENE